MKKSFIDQKYFVLGETYHTSSQAQNAVRKKFPGAHFVAIATKETAFGCYIIEDGKEKHLCDILYEDKTQKTDTVCVVIRVVYRGTPLIHIVKNGEERGFHNAKILMEGSYMDCANKYLF